MYDEEEKRALDSSAPMAINKLAIDIYASVEGRLTLIHIGVPFI